MKRILASCLIIMVLSSHDMFLKLDGFFLEPDTDAEIQLFNGTFTRSDNVITRDRMLDVSLVSNGERIAVDTSQWYEENNITFLRLNAGQEGTKVVGVSTTPRNIEMTAEDFNGYLEHDGVLDMLQWRKDNDAMDQDAVERYSKHVKTIFQVGEQLSEGWDAVLGYPIEFVPLNNPYDIHPGHTFQVRLLFDGKPLPNQLVYVGYESAAGEHTHDDGTTHTHDGDQAETDHQHNDVEQYRTDDQGRLSFEIGKAGVWYLRTIHMEQIKEEGLTHESNWATLTFAIGAGHSHEHGESDHAHGIPSYIYWISSLILVVLLFFWFNRKK